MILFTKPSEIQRSKSMVIFQHLKEQHVFYTAGMRRELEPYLKIAKAVRRGDLVVFQDKVSWLVDS